MSREDVDAFLHGCFMEAYVMPVGALCIILFLGWRYPKAEVFDELTNQGRLKAGYFRIYYFVLRFLAPIALLIILIMGILGNS